MIGRASKLVLTPSSALIKQFAAGTATAKATLPDLP
jgi:hypothetical protein